MNWTGHVIVTPRSRLAEALKRSEFARTGVYFLTGDDPDSAGRLRLYIGEGDIVLDRIKAHARDGSKDFWTHVCVVTSKDANLTKAHARYLEGRLIEIAKVADRASVANAVEPSAKQLPESDSADMEFFISQIQTVLPVIGFDFLRPKVQFGAPASPVDSGFGANVLHLVLGSKKHGINAEALEEDGEIVVLAGSQAAVKDDFASNTYGSLREALIRDGKLVVASDGSHLVFSADVAFASPSAAAAVVLNRNSNGRSEWRVKGSGQTLRDWQDGQLAAALPNAAHSL